MLHSGAAVTRVRVCACQARSRARVPHCPQGALVCALVFAQLDAACTPAAERRLSAVAAAAGGPIALVTRVFIPFIPAAFRAFRSRVAGSIAAVVLLTGLARTAVAAVWSLDALVARVFIPAALRALRTPAAGRAVAATLLAALAAIAALSLLPLDALVAGWVVVAALAGLLAQPGACWARCFLVVSEPRASAAQLAHGGLAAGLARAAFVATAAAAAAVPAGVPSALPGLLLTAAALHAAAFRLMAQAHLDAALVAWHEVHDSAGVDAALAARVMRLRFEATSRRLCKVALHLAAPAAFAVAAAALLAVEHHRPPMPAPFRRAVGSLLGTTACSAWVASVAVTLALFRLRILKP